MRRDFETVRAILMAVGEQGLTTFPQLVAQVTASPEILDYHLRILVRDTDLIKGTRHEGFGFRTPGREEGPLWKDLELTWAGNDLLDAMADEKVWKKMKLALRSSAKVSMIEAIKVVAKGAATAALGVVLAEVEESASERPDVSPSSMPMSPTMDT